MKIVENALETVFPIERHRENKVFEEWKKDQNPETLDQLAELLLKHATAVTFLVFGSRREDVAQESVIKGLEAIEDFRGESLFSTWFHAVAQNHARDRLRQEILARRDVELDVQDLAVEPEIEAAIELDQLTSTLSEQDQELLRDKLEGRVESELTEKYQLTAEGIRSRWDSIKKRIRRRVE